MPSVFLIDRWWRRFFLAAATAGAWFRFGVGPSEVQILDSFHKPTGWLYVMFDRPGKFFAVGMAAAIVPALVRVLATTAFKLAWKRDRQIFFDCDW